MTNIIESIEAAASVIPNDLEVGNPTGLSSAAKRHRRLVEEGEPTYSSLIFAPLYEGLAERNVDQLIEASGALVALINTLEPPVVDTGEPTPIDVVEDEPVVETEQTESKPKRGRPTNAERDAKLEAETAAAKLAEDEAGALAQAEVDAMIADDEGSGQE